jgi:hypothetical protein
VITNDKFRDARHRRDLYKQNSIRALGLKYQPSVVLTSPPYGKQIDQAIRNILAIRAPLTIMKIPVTAANRQSSITWRIELPRERYPGFSNCIKYPEYWAIWETVKKSTHLK